jgi:transcriptional regulator with XRE-family HTH domain
MNLELFREKVRYYRPLTERTQEELANALGLNPSVLSHKLHGIRNARLTHREVQAIVKTLVEWGAMTRQAEARELLELMECPDFLPDEWNAPPFTWLEATTSTRSVQPSHTASPDVEQAVPVQRSGATRPLAHQSSQEAMASPPLHRDWGEAIDVSAFYGRESELVELARWIVEEHCRLVALLSRGGDLALAATCPPAGARVGRLPHVPLGAAHD